MGVEVAGDLCCGTVGGARVSGGCVGACCLGVGSGSSFSIIMMFDRFFSVGGLGRESGGGAADVGWMTELGREVSLYGRGGGGCGDSCAA
jgi:hypothetical protein